MKLWKMKSALALLVTRILAHDAHDALAADDAAGFTKLFDGWTDSHGVKGTKNKMLPKYQWLAGSREF